MPGLLDVLKTPQGFGLLLSGIASAGTGNQSFINNNIAMNDAFQDMAIKREAMEEKRRQRETLARLPGLMQAFTTGVEPQDLGVGENTPAGSVMVDLPMSPARRAAVQGETMGLLSEIAPETMAKGVLGALFTPDQGREPPADIRIMKELGLPLTVAGFEQFNKLKGSGDANAFKGLLDQAQLQKLLLDMENDRKTRGDAAAEKDQKFKLDERAANRNLEDLFELAQLNEDLKDTSLQAGLPASDYRRALLGVKVAASEALGSKEQTQLREQIGKFDRLRKGLKNIVINNKDRFGNNFTNQMQTLLEGASANPDIMPEAIDSILGQLATHITDTSEIMGYDLKNRDRAQEFVERMKGSKPRASAPVVDLGGAAAEFRRDVDAAKATVGGAVDRVREAAPGAVAAGKKAVEDAAVAAKPFLNRAADIARLTIDKIQAITDDDIKAMTEEQKKALLKRVNELKGGK